MCTWRRHPSRCIGSPTSQRAKSDVYVWSGVACWSTCLPTCLLACLPSCSACLLAYLLAYMSACLSALLLADLLACLLAFLADQRLPTPTLAKPLRAKGCPPQMPHGTSVPPRRQVFNKEWANARALACGAAVVCGRSCSVAFCASPVQSWSARGLQVSRVQHGRQTHPPWKPSGERSFLKHLFRLHTPQTWGQRASSAASATIKASRASLASRRWGRIGHRGSCARWHP